MVSSRGRTTFGHTLSPEEFLQPGARTETTDLIGESVADFSEAIILAVVLTLLTLSAWAVDANRAGGGKVEPDRLRALADGVEVAAGGELLLIHA